MKEISCNIIQDLLPNYIDKISSKETNELVEEHIQECNNCKNVLEKMNKDISVKTLDSKADKINFLKGYKKRRKLLILLSIILTAMVLIILFIINVVNKNILLYRDLYVDVNKFNVEYMYLMENKHQKETTTENAKILKVYLYSEEYKNMCLTGEYQLSPGDKEIYYKISAVELPKGVEFDGSGIETSFEINENIEKIYIEDTEHNLKEIWNKNMNVQTEEEWKKWYIDNYVPEEIKEQYKMNYDNMSVDVTIWKKLYNMSIKK